MFANFPINQVLHSLGTRSRWWVWSADSAYTKSPWVPRECVDYSRWAALLCDVYSRLTWKANIFARLAKTGSVAKANVSGHSSTVWIICRICRKSVEEKEREMRWETALLLVDVDIIKFYGIASCNWKSVQLLCLSGQLVREAWWRK